jgi:hypothetical protein
MKFKIAEPPRGQITFRLPLERHNELLEIASVFGIDLTSLLNQMIAETLPSYLEKARQVTAQKEKARAAFDEVALTAEHPRVRELIRLGKTVNKDQRLRLLLDLALQHRKRGDPPLEQILRAAMKYLNEEDQLQEIRAAIEDAATRGSRDRGEG